MITCPNGHASDSDDYCDTCGTPIDRSAVPAPAASAPAAAASRPPEAPPGIVCPHCSTENVADALFCEACGYDFTTGTMPRPLTNPFATLPGDPGDVPSAPATGSADTTPPAGQEQTPHTVEDPARDGEPAATDPAPDQPAPDQPAPDQPAPDQPGVDGSVTADPVGEGADQATATPPRPEEGATSDPGPTALDAAPVPVSDTAPASDRSTTPPPATADQVPTEFVPAAPVDPASPFEWVAEVWVDPDWYRQQEPPDPMPSPGLPEVVPLRTRSALIGRPSRSRNIHPDIDCESDPGASRRQAQLTTDGRRWFVEDLDSSNGTYVAGAAEALPQQPLTPHRRHELDPDDRIYLGAWTRLVIRRATPEEHEAYG